MTLSKTTLTIIAVCFPVLAMAHGVTGGDSFSAGWMHPFSGLDHVALAVAAGICAARLDWKLQLFVPVGLLLALLGGAAWIADPGFLHFAGGFAAATASLYICGIGLGISAARLTRHHHH